MEKLIHLDNAIESLEDAVAALQKAHRELRLACSGQEDRNHLAELKALINKAEALIERIQ